MRYSLQEVLSDVPTGPDTDGQSGLITCVDAWGMCSFNLVLLKGLEDNLYIGTDIGEILHLVIDRTSIVAEVR